MNRTFYSLMARALIALSCFSPFAYTGTPEPVYSATSDSLVQQSATGNVFTSPLFKALCDSLINAKSLNYYTTEHITLPIPGTNQMVVLNWGFKGSGNIFTPFPTITTQLLTTQNSNQLLQSENPSKLEALRDLGIALGVMALKDQADEYTKTVLTPVTLFGLKVVLLVKSTIENPQSRNDLPAELIRLLVRLSLSSDLQMLDAKKPLSSFISTDLKTAAESKIPGCIDFIDELWKQFTSATTPEVTSRTITCFTFRDKDFADKVLQKVNKYDGSALVDYVSTLINTPGNKHEVVDLPKFTQYSKSRELVGHVHTTQIENSNLPVSVKLAVKSTSIVPMTTLVDAGNGEQWLCYVSNKLTPTDAIKALTLSFARTLHDYVALKKDLFTSQTPEAIAYRKQWQEEELKLESIRAFLASEEGKASFATISQAVTSVMQPEKAQLVAAQDVKLSKENKLRDIQALEMQRNKLTSMISVNEKINQDCKKLRKQLEPILAEIKQMQAELADFTIEVTPAEKQEQDKKDLAKLEERLRELQERGQEPSEKLLTAITTLRSNVKKVVIEPKQTSIDIEQRLAKREMVATIFTTEAANVEKQLTKKRDAIQQISDENQRTTQELLFGKTQEKYEQYIQCLRQEAQRIIATNKMAKKLKLYKKSLADGIKFADIGKEKQEEIQSFETQVGYLFTAAQDENFLQRINGPHLKFGELLIISPADQEMFNNMEAKFMQTLGGILKNAEGLEENAQAYGQTIARLTSILFPSLLPLVNNVMQSILPVA